MLEKGIVIAPDFDFDGRNLTYRGISGQSIRQSILYWDKIEIPSSNLIELGTTPDLQFLIDEGVLQRTSVRLENFSGNMGFGVIETQIRALKINLDKEPGQWSISQHSNSLCFGSSGLKEQHLIEFELHKCMPIPTSDVPYEEILEYKSKRSDEYSAFKELVGDLYLEIVDSADIPRAKNHTLNKLELAIKDIEKVNSESFTKRIFKTFTINLNPLNLVQHGLSGIGASTVLGLPIELGAACGSLGGALNLNVSKQRTPIDTTLNQRGIAYLIGAQKTFSNKVGRNDLCPCGSGLKFKKCHLNFS